jgi:hypothetical protein
MTAVFRTMYILHGLRRQARIMALYGLDWMSGQASSGMFLRLVLKIIW